MKKRLGRSAIVVVLVSIVVVIVIVWYELRSERFGPAVFERLSPGMSLSEVESTIGCPPGNYCTRSDNPWVNYCLREKGLSIDQIWPKDAQRAKWFGDNYCIWVLADAHGSVIGVYLMTAISPDESRFRKTVQRLRYRLELGKDIKRGVEGLTD